MPSASEAYAAIVASVIDRLEEGVMPWRRPWVVQRPTNLFTRKAYTGINVLALMNAAERRGFRSSSWLTENQARKRGGVILANEADRPAHIAMMYLQSFAVTARGGARVVVKRLVGRSYAVYNLEQTRGLGRLEHDGGSLELWNHSSERIVREWKEAPSIVSHRAEAFYRPSDDVIAIPASSQFASSNAYYATLFHEMIHATGHASRLGRHAHQKGDRRFGGEAYALEELVAELGAAFLCSEAGIGNVGLQDNASYIDSWMKVLSGDKRRLFFAAHQAERACSLVMGREIETVAADDDRAKSGEAEATVRERRAA